MNPSDKYEQIKDIKRLNPVELEAMVLKHEQQIKDIAEHLLELRKWGSPMMEFKQEMPTMGMEYAANFEKAEKLLEKKECYDSPGPSYTYAVYPPDPPKKWVGLTEEEIEELPREQAWWETIRAVEALLKEKNGG